MDLALSGPFASILRAKKVLYESGRPFRVVDSDGRILREGVVHQGRPIFCLLQLSKPAPASA